MTISDTILRDGVAAEIIYPTVGMVLCNHRDGDYKHACFDAYNLWIAEFCATDQGSAASGGEGGSSTLSLGRADQRWA